jgi:hypothetical protein
MTGTKKKEKAKEKVGFSDLLDSNAYFRKTG